MTDLIEFLRARLDEDEQAARAATPGPWHALDGGVIDDENEQWPVAETQSDRDRADRVHIARHDPARVLREVEAKRRILRAHDKWCQGECEAKYPEGGFDAAHYWSIKSLAAAYSDHPDYREEWRP